MQEKFINTIEKPIVLEYLKYIIEYDKKLLYYNILFVQTLKILYHNIL